MGFSVKLGNFLYRNAFSVYKPLYIRFKNRQDAFEIKMLKQHIRAGDVVLDIGANIGFYAQLLSELAGANGAVHCFEPDPKNFSHLQTTAAGLKNVVLNNKAVGPRTERLKIYTSKNLNVDHRTYKPDDYEDEIEIDAVSIDEYLGSRSKVDFIKMDIQGFEMQAVRGMIRTLRANPGVKLISEFWPYGLRKAGSSCIEYFEFLRAQGFTCQLLEGNSLSPLTPQRVQSLEPLGEEHYFNIFASGPGAQTAA